MHKYKDILQYMFSKLPMYQRQGSAAYKKDLTNVIRLCDALGNPQNGVKFVHVAGTNGKGSTSHLLAGMLQMSGYKTGLFVSPHYKDFRERIRINGQMIEKKFIVEFITENLALIEEIQPSFFELNFVLALEYFKVNKIDIAVIEVGLGGRLDSTNIITPLLSVITNISFDHMDMLGNTLELIASEKAGIIKDHIPVLVGEYQEGIAHVFKNKAAARHAPISYAKDIVALEKLSATSYTEEYSFHYFQDGYKGTFQTSLTGPYQYKNLSTAMAAIKLLSSMMKINWNKLCMDFVMLGKMTGLIGRWQVLSSHPLIICDSAHNEAGIKNVIDQLYQLDFHILHIVIGFVNDKDLSEVLTLMPHDAVYYFCKADIPRGLDAKKLKQTAESYNLKGRAYSSVKNAFAAARKNASSDDLIFVGGSIYVVAEVI